MKGIAHVLFLIRAAGEVGRPHAEAIQRMLREDREWELVERVGRAIATPFTEAQKAELMKPNGLEPS